MKNFQRVPHQLEHRVFGRDSFVTTHAPMKYIKSLVPSLGGRDHFYLHGPKGSGKRALAQYIWEKNIQKGRLFVAEPSHVVKSIHDLNRVRKKIRLGDLCLVDFDQLVPDLQSLVLKQPWPEGVRLIATGQKPLNDSILKMFSYSFEIPSLRKRPEDLEFLFLHFLREWGEGWRVSDDALNLIRHSVWPGEVEQLKYCVERAVRICWELGVSKIDRPIIEEVIHAGPDSILPMRVKMIAEEQVYPLLHQLGMRDLMNYFEAAILQKAMKERINCLSHAATTLRMPITTLLSRIESLKPYLQ